MLPLRHRLSFKVAATMSALLSLGLLTYAAMELTTTRRHALEQVASLQQAQAQEVASAVRGTLGLIKSYLSAVTVLPWEIPGWLTLEDRRNEYRRLLRLAPAIDSIRWVGPEGKEQLFVSRREVDRVGAGVATLTTSTAKQAAGVSESAQLHYAQGFDPTLSVSLEGTEVGRGTTVIDVNLRSLASGLADALVMQGRVVYAADEIGRVVLHRDPGVIVSRLSVADTEHFKEIARGAERVVRSKGLDGGDVLVTSVSVGLLGWRVYVEQPTRDALRPVEDALVRTAALALMWLAVVVAVGLYFARRLTRPIAALAQGAAALAAGDLAARIQIDTKDELSELALQFNSMASALQDTIQNQEQRIAEKTLALETANRHKSEFLSNMSHELRTPLNSIIAMSEVLEDQIYGPMTTKQLQYAHFIHTSGNDLLAQINDILDMSKIEAGTMVLQPAMVDVTSLALEALASVREMADKKSICLDFDASQRTIEWPADRRRVKQIMLNLLSNAVKFTGPGGRVSIDLTTTDAHLCLRVVDTGCGIAEKDLPHLFQPFRQFDGRDDLRAEGAGLGLALVRRLAGLHGGTVTARSEVGVGSRFTVELPRLLPASSTSTADRSGVERHGEGISEVPS